MKPEHSTKTNTGKPRPKAGAFLYLFSLSQWETRPGRRRHAAPRPQAGIRSRAVRGLYGTRECRHIHRHSCESGNPKAIGSNPVLASYRILGSRFRGNDGNRRLETDILKLTTLPTEYVVGSIAGFWCARNSPDGCVDILDPSRTRDTGHV